ncbi:hypothetical protein NIES2109_09100 [Nostoc sp. HK-01]|uniref:Uncharacterized protein n=1 Tax=Anabaenopsis circularis NIES-21 TaxID=1085406 RepID=A0A1Z4GLU9_9CYAN|nr:hypothetical protein NIES21_41840 [Anabaenopsis circularis NIES-21]BBD58139.1 hypothetical protein NIES2109_09100 [Nostoc sp. HK-01]
MFPPQTLFNFNLLLTQLENNTIVREGQVLLVTVLQLHYLDSISTQNFGLWLGVALYSKTLTSNLHPCTSIPISVKSDVLLSTPSPNLIH